MDPYRVHPEVRVGHVHLRVADLERSIAFYRDVLGFDVTLDARTFGLPLVLLAAGDYHHHIALNTWHSAGGAPLPEGFAGLHHVAFLYPEREELGRAVARLFDRGHEIIDVRQERSDDGEGLRRRRDEIERDGPPAPFRLLEQGEARGPIELLEESGAAQMDDRRVEYLVIG